MAGRIGSGTGFAVAGETAIPQREAKTERDQRACRFPLHVAVDGPIEYRPPRGAFSGLEQIEFSRSARDDLGWLAPVHNDFYHAGSVVGVQLLDRSSRDCAGNILPGNNGTEFELLDRNLQVVTDAWCFRRSRRIGRWPRASCAPGLLWIKEPPQQGDRHLASTR